MQLVEIETERAAIQTLWEESQALGPERGRQLLGRCGFVAEDFQNSIAQRLFAAICMALGSNRVPVLLPGDREAAAYLETLELRTAAKLDAWADRIKSLSVRRALDTAAREIHRLAHEGELAASELVAKAKAIVGAAPMRTSNWEDLSAASSRVVEHLQAVAEGRLKPAVATGFAAIDEATGGLPATLIVIVAMPGVGKSAWVGSMIRNIAQRGEKVAIYSMEDAAEWLVFRFLAHETRIKQGVLRNHRLHEHQWSSVNDGFAALGKFGRNILVDDRESLTPAEVLSGARDAINRGAKAIFLDNMTAMRFPRGERRDLEFQDFLVAARGLANETGVPFVAISHAKRREGLDVSDLPLLTDCAESSAYEKLCRLAYGLARNKGDNTLKVGVLKNTNGKAWQKFDLELRPESALVEAEERQPKPWNWGREVEHGNF